MVTSGAIFQEKGSRLQVAEHTTEESAVDADVVIPGAARKLLFFALSG